MTRTEIRIPNNKYWVDSNPMDMSEWQWCFEKFGRVNNNKDSNHWQINVTYGEIVGRFNNPQHATMFALKWA
jgi:hypothetical protein